MTSTSTTVFLGLGSNLGNRQKHFRHAISCLVSAEGAPLEECSSFYDTEPFGVTGQPSFLNAVVSLKTRREPFDFLETIKSVERRCGRACERIRWGPRELDVDILFWGDRIILSDDLTVPHRGLPERKFVLVPLNEIAPGLIHPELGAKIGDLLESCADSSTPVPVPPDPDLWPADEIASLVKRFQITHTTRGA